MKTEEQVTKRGRVSFFSLQLQFTVAVFSYSLHSPIIHHPSSTTYHPSPNTHHPSPMKAVIQRVSQASVTIENKITATIGQGLLVLIGIEEADSEEDIVWLASKIANLRIFEDENQVMNLAVKEINGEIILVSQFTLHASTKKGNRPSYIKAARPELAIPIYEKFIVELEKEVGIKIHTGIFGANMKVGLVNDGPVTILFNTKNKE
jgi:D-tyrosyl-tRNA(Tyr) deacylase